MGKGENKKNKKGISPVIATILLIIIAIALFVVIFFWIKSMQREVILKFNSGIQQSCQRLSFDVSFQGNEVQVQNTGTITIWRVKIFKQVGGSLIEVPNGIPGPIYGGEAASVSVSNCEKIKVIPVLLGASQKTGAEKEYICQERAKTIGC